MESTVCVALALPLTTLPQTLLGSAPSNSWPRRKRRQATKEGEEFRNERESTVATKGDGRAVAEATSVPGRPRVRKSCQTGDSGLSVCRQERTEEETLSIYLPVRLNINQLLGTISTLVIHTTSEYVMSVRSYAMGTDHRANRPP